MTQPAHPITTRTGAVLVADDGPARAMAMDLHWRRDDPYAVRVLIHDGYGRAVTWRVSRELLHAGLRTRAGAGDVRVWPAAPGLTGIELCSPSGRAVFEIHTVDLTRFLRATRRSVPFGAERWHLHLEAELSRLLDNPTGSKEGPL